MAKVCVLLSAYNGEQFIEEQLRSLLQQEQVEVQILVRDDGSTDRTPEILDRWQREEPLRWYGGENLGWAMSFMHLLTHAAPDADYYAFCDQDDIWLPDKLSRAVGMIEQQEQGCVLYCSNVTYYRNGREEGLVKPAGLHFDIYTAMVKCLTVGCTMVMDNTLASHIRNHPPHRVSAHDFWVYQVASAIGTVCYDETSHMLYRQHDHNQIGQKRTWREVWQRRMKTLRTFWSQHDREETRRWPANCSAAMPPVCRRRGDRQWKRWPCTGNRSPDACGYLPTAVTRWGTSPMIFSFAFASCWAKYE